MQNVFLHNMKSEHCPPESNARHKLEHICLQAMRIQICLPEILAELPSERPIEENLKKRQLKRKIHEISDFIENRRQVCLVACHKTCLVCEFICTCCILAITKLHVIFFRVELLDTCVYWCR